MKRMPKYTTEDFIRMSKEKFGDKYLYDKTIYVGSKYKLTITCPKHGDFEITPNKHLGRGDGCPYCSGHKLHYTDFKERAQKIHNGKYKYPQDMTQEEFVKSRTIPIECPEHGVFMQSATAHLAGEGCPRCSHTVPIDFNEFMRRVSEKHKEKGYIYHEDKYKGYNYKTTITCPIHGDFEQTPEKHVKGQGCPECAGTRKSNTEEFIRKATAIHQGVYKYDKVKYVNNRTPVIVTCPIHGDFSVTPHNHLRRRGCPQCGKESIGLHEMIPEEEVIRRANEVHHGRYLYPNTRYVGMKRDMYIVCPIHGEFIQNADAHLHGCGCPKCSQSKMELTVMDFLDKNNIKYTKEKRFDWLRYKSKLRLDFYLPDYNIAIECQGAQRFTPTDFSGHGEEWALANYSKIKQTDAVKKKLCEENGVRLLYFCNLDCFDTFLGEKLYKTTDELLAIIG